MKRRNRSSKRRRQITFLILTVILFMFAAGPFVVRMELLREAKRDYDIRKVQEELRWLEKYGGPLNALEYTNDTKLWLELNLGSKEVESTLTGYQDEKHLAWLANFYSQVGDFTKAQSILETMDPSPRTRLGKGLLSLAKGEAKETQTLLAGTESDWKSLTPQEQCLRHLSLAQAAISLEDIPSVNAELDTAQKLDPKNPTYLTVRFNLAIAQGDWAKAIQISQLIDDQTWRPPNSLYLIKGAILAIHENDPQGLSHRLTLLEKLPREEGSIHYVKGINALKKGQLQEGKTLLELALKDGLEGEVKADAQKALEQVSERQKVESTLQTF